MEDNKKQRKSRNFLFGFIIHVFYGIYYLFYILLTPIRLMFKNNKNKGKIKTDELSGNIENSQEKIDKVFEKKKKIDENKRLNEEKKQAIIIKKQEEKEKKAAELAKKKEKQEEKNRIKREKQEQIKLAREEKLKQKQERLQLEKEKKAAELAKKKEEQEEKNRIKREKQEQIKLAREEKLKQKQERLQLEKEKKEVELAKKREKQEEINRIKREKKEKIKAEKDAKIQAKLEKKRLAKEQKNLSKQERLEAEKLRKEEIQKNEISKKEQAKLKKEEIKRIRDEKRRAKKAAKEQARLDKKEAELAKKRKSEAYVNENYKGETGKKGLKGIIEAINNLPKKIKESFSKSYKNSLLYRNAKNKKDRQRQVLLINFDGEDAIKSEQKQVYQYVGKNADGKVVTDYFPAYSRVEVHSFLLSEGFEVYSIKTSKLINILHKSSASVNTKFKNKDLIFFLTQLSTYIKAGIPLVESLKILSRQFKKKSYQKIFRAMIYNLTMGDSFSIAMEKQGRAFPSLLINMIKASEMTGELPEALDDMAEYFTETEATRKQMVTALTYPAIVFVFALGVITFIMLYVVPKFVDIYNSMDSGSIPSFTMLVMNISNFLQDNVLWVFGAIVAFIILITVAYRNVKAFRWAMQWLFMHIPVIKNIIIYNEVTMFTKTFSSLLAHNVFITDTLEILSKITNNEIYKMLVKDTAANLERGEKISTAYKDQWAFPIPAYEMIVTGERTGQLAEMMSKVSTYYQDLHKNTVSRLKAFIEPILIVGLTVVVGFIVLAIVIPMFNLYNQVI